MRKRRNIEIFSLYFLDGMSCAFGAVIMLLLLTKAAEPRIIEAAKTRVIKAIRTPRSRTTTALPAYLASSSARRLATSRSSRHLP